MDIRVLIVDGSLSELSFIGEALEEVGVEYITTPDCQNVLEVAKEFRPTLIVTDINMPKSDGHTIVQQVKTCQETSHIPVIFFSASDKQEDVIKGLHYGSIDFISKPINVQDFVKVVISHSSVDSMREILSPLKFRTSELMKKYDDDFN